jgi:anti-sigma regulatory factor (Ser/Thr protein kinase)
MGVTGAPPVLLPGMRWRRVFQGDASQLGIVRRWLASLLPESPARDDLASVATELGSNAIRHTASGRGGWFAVEIMWYGPVVRVAVADSGGPTEPQLIGPDQSVEHGWLRG